MKPKLNYDYQSANPTFPDRPLFKIYRGQSKPQPAFISLDLDDCEVKARFSGEIGNAVTFREYYGRVRKYRVTSTVHRNTLDDLFGSLEFLSLIERILAGSSIEFKGSNYCGRLNDDGHDAERELRDLLDALEFESENFLSLEEQESL